VHGGPAADSGLGGAGDDTFVDADEAADNYDGGDGFDAMHHDRATAFTGSLTTRRAAEDLLTSVEGLRGGVRHDRLTGSPGDDHLDGDAGDDRLSGRAGDDVLVDGDGDDVLRGGPGNDVLHHSSGRDRPTAAPVDETGCSSAPANRSTSRGANARTSAVATPTASTSRHGWPAPLASTGSAALAGP
jgi:Ca2+-binding RTX toxin-like protein